MKLGGAHAPGSYAYAWLTLEIGPQVILTSATASFKFTYN